MTTTVQTPLPASPQPGPNALLRERAIRFGSGERLVGILTDPADGEDAQRPTAVFVTAGMLHRVGPNRLYVTLARRLARLGVPSMRFDLSEIARASCREA